MKTGDLLRKARAVRIEEHRLRPGLRLKTIEEVRDFVHAKGLVSVLGGNELPSVISAILGRPWKPSKKGFTGWLDWWSVKISGRPIPYWAREMETEKDILATRIFRQTKTLVSSSLWPMLTPIIKWHEQLVNDHKILSKTEWSILVSLREHGPTRTDHLRDQLGLQGREHTSRFHQSLVQLESRGLIVGYEDPNPEKHLHANIWQPWTSRAGPLLKEKTGVSYIEALESLLERTIDAAILASEKEVERWFKWEGSPAEAVENLVRGGKVIRVGSSLVTARIAE